MVYVIWAVFFFVCLLLIGLLLRLFDLAGYPAF